MSKKCFYKIYQIHNHPLYEKRLFTSLDSLKSNGLKVEQDDYKHVYTDNFTDEDNIDLLNRIFISLICSIQLTS